MVKLSVFALFKNKVLVLKFDWAGGDSYVLFNRLAIFLACLRQMAKLAGDIKVLSMSI